MSIHPEHIKSWERALKMIEDDTHPASYKEWIKPLRLHAVSVDRLIVEVRSAFHMDYVKKMYRSTLYNVCAMTFEKRYELEFVTSDQLASAKSALASTMLNPKYTFENFVVGPSNNFAYAAALAVAEQPSDVYNPLFIYGGVGLGKTHLMNAIGNYIAEVDPKKSVLFISSETFTNQLIDSIVKKQGTSDLRNRMRNVDVLMVDDIQFLSKTVATQEEFFHTFNDLHGKKKQIIISSDRPPKEIPTIEERLRSRFEWGLIVDIQKPDYETRVAILRKRAMEEDIGAPDDALEYIAERVDSNIRELEGSLVRVNARAQFTGGEITLEMARTELEKLLGNGAGKKVTPEGIILAVAQRFDVSEDDLYSKRRSRDIAGARQVAMYLMRDMLQLSTTAVGRIFGGRDHTTVMHGCEKISGEIKADAQMRRTVEELRATVKGR